MRNNMKKLVLFAIGALLAGTVLGQGRINAPTVRREALPPVNAPAQSEGSLQRGVRLGNPAQMFNPFAPARYGEGREFVTVRGDEQSVHPRNGTRTQPVGLRLFSIAF